MVIAESRNSKAGNLKSNEEKVLNLKKQFKIILNESLQNIFENLNNSTSNLSILDDILKETNLELYSNLFSGLGFGEINKNNISSFINSNKGKVLEILDISFDSIIDTLNLTMKLKVKDSIKSPKGKWPSVMGNVIVLDYHYISQILIKKFVSNFKKRIEDKIGFLASLVSDEEIEKIILERSNDFDLKQFAMFEYLTFKNKLEIYANEKTIDIKLVEFSNKLSKLLGKNYITQTDVALSGVIKKMSIIKSFLDNVFGSSVILLIMLSILLIYSLMVSNVDEKTFEFGMLRALGFNKTHMLSLLFIQALVFAFLGMFLAFLFSFILNAMICYIIYDYSLLAASYIPSEMSLILGFSIGLIMPIISNVFPILRALSKTLRDSLDLFHREINIFRVRVMKLEKLGVSLYQSLNAVVLITVGFSSYYLAPKAFIMQDIPMFLWIMNLILIIFLLGLTAFLNLFELFFEKLILKLILFLLFTDRKLESIIQKNIKGHRSRNLKTTLMFSITMSFLIFAGTGFQLQETAINDTFRLHIGSDMTAEIPPNSKIFLDEYALRQFLESYKLKYPNQIESYSFSSIPFDQMPKVHFPALSPLSFYPRRRVSIKAVEDNFLKSVYSHYFTPVQYDETLIYDTLEDGKRDSVFALSSSKNIEYFSIMKDLHHITSNNEMRTINKTEEKMRILQFLLPEGNRNYFGVEPNIPAIILMGNLKYPSKITTMIAKMPGFGMFFSSYMTASKMVITSMENFKFLMEKEWDGLSIYEKETIKDFYERNPKNMTYDIPKEKIFIKFARPLQETERSELANGLRNQFKNMITVLFDTADFIRDIHEAFFYLDIFYYVVALISIILSFFLILVSFSSNVKEHVWEFGVLRSLGLNKTQMTRIYIYEALCLTIASGLIGTAVGVIVALILTMQYLTFAEIPMVFQFPWSMFLITFFSGIFTSISGSYLALKEIREKPISAIIKGLN